MAETVNVSGKRDMEFERSEINALIEDGLIFKVGRREFWIKQPYLGTMDILSGLYLQMQLDLTDNDEDGVSTSVNIVKRTAKLWAKVAAIAVLNNKWKIKFLTPFLTNYFLWRLNPSSLQKLVKLILQTNDVLGFIRSTRSIAGIRTTKPNLVEKKETSKETKA